MNEPCKVTLISPYGGVLAYGLRVISAYLKANGHDVKLVYFPSWNFAHNYEGQVIEDLIEVCKDSDVIGITLMACYFVGAKHLTEKLKEKLDIPIIWGGIHPTVRPEECIEYADMICVGEGEEAMLDLANRIKSGDIDDIENLWIKKADGQIIKNETRPLEMDLDKYPYQDYDIETHYIQDGDRLVKMNHTLLEQEMGEDGFFVLTTRGCPYNCTYCCNNALKNIYKGKGRYFRKRDPVKVIDEIETIKNKLGFLKWVSVKDDTFFIRRLPEIKTFCELYKERINLPMRVVGSPLDISEEKLDLVTDAGANMIGMGIQTYNQETLSDIYKRPATCEMVEKTVKILDKYRDHFKVIQYHFIIDNPYEKSILPSLQFAASLPPGTEIAIFPLTPYPGTGLYDLYQKDGLIKNEIHDIYLRSWKLANVNDVTYYVYVFYLCQYLKMRYKSPRFPSNAIIKFLIRKEVAFVLDNPVTMFLILLGRKIHKNLTRRSLRHRWNQVKALFGMKKTK